MISNLHKIAMYVYEEYLSKPYTDRSTFTDWDYRYQSTTINRPNHGLAHTLRTTAFVPHVLDAMLLHADTDKLRQELQNLQQSQEKIQVALLFAVVGRGNECGFKENPRASQDFKRRSSEAFRQYCQKIDAPKFTAQEIERFADALQKFGDPIYDNKDTLTGVMSICHKLDLPRCFNEAQHSSAVMFARQKVGSRNLDELVKYALRLIVTTGDRIMPGYDIYGDFESQSYLREKFCQASTSPEDCLEFIQETLAPHLALTSNEDRARDGVVENFADDYLEGVIENFKLLTNSTIDYLPTHGPLPKSKASYTLENIVRRLLNQEAFAVEAQIDGLYIKFSDKNPINLTKILTNANFNHLSFNSIDLDAYVAYCRQYSLIKPSINLRFPSQEVFTKRDSEKRFNDMPYAAKLALNIYSRSAYKEINPLLRGDCFLPDHENRDAQICDAIIHSAMCGYALAHAPTEKIKEAVRYEKLNDSNSTRIEMLKDACKTGISVNERGFTSSTMVTTGFPRYPVRIVYNDLMVTYVAALSNCQEEKECLLPPTQMTYLANVTEKNNIYFFAHPTLDLAQIKEDALVTADINAIKIYQMQTLLLNLLYTTQLIATVKISDSEVINKLESLNRAVLQHIRHLQDCLDKDDYIKDSIYTEILTTLWEQLCDCSFALNTSDAHRELMSRMRSNLEQQVRALMFDESLHHLTRSKMIIIADLATFIDACSKEEESLPNCIQALRQKIASAQQNTATGLNEAYQNLEQDLKIPEVREFIASKLRIIPMQITTLQYLLKNDFIYLKDIPTIYLRSVMFDTELAQKILSNNPSYIQFATEEMRNNYSIMLEVLRKDKTILPYVGHNAILDCIKHRDITFKELPLYILNSILRSEDTPDIFWDTAELEQVQDIINGLESTQQEHCLNSAKITLIIKLLQNDEAIFDKLSEIRKLRVARTIENCSLKERLLAKCSQNADDIYQADYELWHGSENQQADKLKVMRSISNDPYALRHASKEMKDDKEVVIKAVSKAGCTLQYASERLKDDKEVVIKAVSKYGHALEFASDRLQDDKEVVIEAVSQYGYALKFASDRLQDDKEVVSAAVSSYGCALQYASERLQDDKHLVLMAVSKDAFALAHASENILRDKDVYIAAVSQNSMFLGFKYTPETIQDDEDVVMAAVSKHGSALRFASERLKNNRNVVMRAVSNTPLALEYASEKMQDDEDIVKAAVSQDGLALQYASKKMQGNKDIVLAAVSQNGLALQYASKELLINNKDIVETAIAQNSSARQYIPQKYSIPMHQFLSKKHKACAASPDQTTDVGHDTTRPQFQ